MNAQKIDLWSVTVEDKPGALAKILKGFADTKINLEVVLARREPDKPGQGVVLIGPIRGKKAAATAEAAGFKKVEGMYVVRLEGIDKPGLGSVIADKLGSQGINMRELDAMVIGRRFTCYMVFDSEGDVAKALRVLRKFG